MKRLLSFVALLVVACQVGYSSSKKVVEHCGKERWEVKTSADKDLSKVDFNPVQSTVAQLTAFAAPSRADLDAHPDTRFPEEMKVYTVTGYLVGFKRETDEDLHIVIADLQNKSVTMIVEMPSGNCVPATLVAYSNNLQESFEKRFGKAVPRFKKVPGNVKLIIKGMGFFDFLHGQTGVAKNGFELHRVIEWGETK